MKLQPVPDKINLSENEYVLIVDDTPENLELLTDLLKSKYRLKAAVNGEGCLKIAGSSEKPSLILLDIMMPGIDGYEVCRRLKASPETADIPVIFLTAMGAENDIVRGFETGAVDYVRKPFNPHELLSRVKTHLSIRRQEKYVQQLSEERKELLHMLCHDLANPLGFVVSVKGLAQRDPEEFMKFKDDIFSVVEGGMEMINLVRKMMALDEKKIQLSVEKQNLRQMLDESLQILGRRIADKKITLDVEVSDDASVQVERVSFVNSVMNNLLTNALKFSEAGSVIKINAQRNNGHLDLSVRDFGIGMPESILKNVFNASKTVSRSGTAGERGTGYGMPLLKKFVEAYGGSLSIASTEKAEDPEDHGTEIVVHLLS